jgi:hypothetical protein
MIPLTPYFESFYVVPEAVQRNLATALPSLVGGKARVVVAPHCQLAENLFLRGMFHGLNVVGFLTVDDRDAGDGIASLPVFRHPESVVCDVIVWVGTGQRPADVARFGEIVSRRGIKLVDLCDGYDPAAHRHELARQLDQLGAHIQGVSMHVEIRMPGWGLGDRLCALSAARELARRRRDLTVHFNFVPRIVDAFNDDLVTAGHGQTIDIARSETPYFFWEKMAGVGVNYAGCYQLGLGMDFSDVPVLELPRLPARPGLEPKAYIVIQPRAEGMWGKPHLRLFDLQRIIYSSPLPVILAGRPGSGLGLFGIERSYAGNELDMLQLIQHAALVLTPRSAGAHIAAAYGVPSIVWVPDDDLNWHLNYPDWPHRRFDAGTPHMDDIIIAEMSRMLSREVRKAEISVSRKIALVIRLLIATSPHYFLGIAKELAGYMLRCLPSRLLRALRNSPAGPILRAARVRWGVP